VWLLFSLFSSLSMALGISTLQPALSIHEFYICGSCR
jgi:hypothetical protein